MGKISHALYQELKDDLFHYLSDVYYVPDFNAASLDDVSDKEIRDTVFSQGTGSLSVDWAYSNLSREPGFQLVDGRPQYTAQQFQDFVYRLQSERPGILFDNNDRNIWRYSLASYEASPSNIPPLLEPSQAYEFLTTQYGSVSGFCNSIKLLDPDRAGDVELLFNKISEDLSGDSDARTRAHQFLKEFDLLFSQCGEVQVTPEGYKVIVALPGFESSKEEFLTAFREICRKYGYTSEDIARARTQRLSQPG